MFSPFKRSAPASPSPVQEPDPAAAEQDVDDGVEPLPGGKARVTLRWPVQFGKTLVDSVVIRRARGEDMKVLPNEKRAKPYEHLQFLGNLIEDQPRVFIDKVDLEDVARIGEVVKGFFPAGLTTGQAD